MGFGNAIDVSSPDVIVGYAVNNGANSNVMVYSLVSATSPAPEPSTLILVPFAASLVMLGRYARRRSCREKSSVG